MSCLFRGLQGHRDFPIFGNVSAMNGLAILDDSLLDTPNSVQRSALNLNIPAGVLNDATALKADLVHRLYNLAHDVGSRAFLGENPVAGAFASLRMPSTMFCIDLDVAALFDKNRTRLLSGGGSEVTDQCLAWAWMLRHEFAYVEDNGSRFGQIRMQHSTVNTGNQHEILSVTRSQETGKALCLRESELQSLASR